MTRQRIRIYLEKLTRFAYKIAPVLLVIVSSVVFALYMCSADRAHAAHIERSLALCSPSFLLLPDTFVHISPRSLQHPCALVSETSRASASMSAFVPDNALRHRRSPLAPEHRRDQFGRPRCPDSFASKSMALFATNGGSVWPPRTRSVWPPLDMVEKFSQESP